MHMRSLGLNSENYRLPLLLREKIRSVIRHFNRRDQQRNNILDGNRMNRIRHHLRDYLNRNMTEGGQIGWRDVEVVGRNNSCFAICPVCQKQYEVWYRTGNHFRGFTFLRHIRQRHPAIFVRRERN